MALWRPSRISFQGFRFRNRAGYLFNGKIKTGMVDAIPVLIVFTAKPQADGIIARF
jgi:urocanate hydratase